jgi:uncharacterized protein (DUF885 family)
MQGRPVRTRAPGSMACPRRHLTARPEEQSIAIGYCPVMSCRRALALFLAVSCAHAPPAESPQASGFAKFVDEYFAARFANAPSRATGVGFHELDARLEDLSRSRITAQISELKQFQTRLAGMRGGQLSFDEEIDAQLIDNQIEAALLELTVVRGWERNPMLYAGLPGNAIDSLMKRDFAPAPDRLRSAIARLSQVPRIYAEARQNLANPAKELTDVALRMARGSVGFLQGTVSEWAKTAAAGDATLLAQFEQVHSPAVAAARDFVEWLQRDLAPRSHGSYAIGAETFAAKLKYEEMVTVPLPQILARGEAQLAKDHGAFLETARQIDPARSPAEVMKSLSSEHPSAEDLIPSVARSVEAARQFVVDKEIVTIPSQVRVMVAPTPPYARSGSFASMDTPGPYEHKATEAFYYVTPVEPEWDAKHREEHLRLYNPWVVGMINVHEAYPGHYLQFLYAPRFPTKTRKLARSASNSEGWAHYAEQMAVDHGFGKGDPKMRLAQLQEALLRDCRYVVGIKLHTEGWTVEQGAKLFVEQGFQEPANAYEEARRGAYNPTYLYYTLGKLEIQGLAREYMARKNGTLRQFHDAFVAQGALPIPLIRKILFR